MKIAAVTMVYNEALILPYFLRYYEYLDEIHVLYETDSADDTLRLLKNASNVVIEHVHIKSGNDALDKTDLINQAFYKIKADWVYVLDPDEFIFPPNETPDNFLGRQNYDVVRAALFQVYRHRTEKDLDPSLPIISQRIHGDRDIFSTTTRPNRDFNAQYIKPIIVRPSTGIRFTPGKHGLEGNIKVSPEFYMGAHWNMADQSIAIVRRMQIKNRQSERQIKLGLGWQHTNVTEEWIKEECDRHLDDPVIQELIPVDKKSPEEITALCNKSFIQEAIILELKNKNMEITAGFAWWAGRKIVRFIDTILPPNTRRRQLAGRFAKLFKIIP
jgi:hypothetical protein